MSGFTASNGVGVSVLSESIIFDRGAPTSPVWLRPEEIAALREFFQHERDTELGRWRFPGNPDYVVYPWVADPSRGKRGVTVASETIPRTYTVWEDVFYGTSENEEARKQARAAARAYFDAHPEPKPWHDAKPGEVWLLTVRGRQDVPAIVREGGIFLCDGDTARFDAPVFTAGRRIFPEVAS